MRSEVLDRHGDGILNRVTAPTVRSGGLDSKVSDENIKSRKVLKTTQQEISLHTQAAPSMQY